MTISLASFAPLTTGPPANTCSPLDSALLPTFLPCCLTTVLLTRSQVQMELSAERTTRLPPATDWITPRLNAMVRTPDLVLKVNSPCIDRKSTRLNSSHLVISYAVFC